MMENKKSTVCVIGAGLSGLASIKCMRDAGHHVVCYEKDKDICGKWSGLNKTSIPRSTVTNIPHFMSGYSDYPIPDDYPLYCTAEKYCSYLKSFAQKFDLNKHIKLGCNVTNAEPLLSNIEHEESFGLLDGPQRWSITYQCKEGKINVEEFDFLVVCSGFYTLPYVPELLNEKVKNFNGIVMHAIDYRSAKDFENKTVVVCGLGNTGGDIVSELSDHCLKAYISTSRGTYVIGRMTTRGKIPVAEGSLRIAQYIPSFIKRRIKDFKCKQMANTIYNLNDLCLTPKTTSSLIINDEICVKIASGKVFVRPTIERVDGSTVYFSNGTFVENVDVIMFCTGYARKFSFFDDGMIQLERNGKYFPLYRKAFTTKFRESLAFIGMYSVPGSFVSTSEMQARYAAEIFKKQICLPSNNDMEKAIKHDAMQEDGELKEYNMISDPWSYYDELAYEIGCRPSILYLCFSDPLLAWYLLGRYSSHEYRLVGPNKWDGARNAILNRSDKMYAFMEDSKSIP